MRVTVDVKGEETHEFSLEDVPTESAESAGAESTDIARTESTDTAGPKPTYADLLSEIDLSPHEVSVLVDGRPVPEDQPVESEHITVLRLIKGG